MKRVLVTGASGFVGRHCLPLLLEKGFEVHAITSSKQADNNSGVYWHALDLAGLDGIRSVVGSVLPTHLLHLAWFVQHGAFWHSPQNERWVDITKEIVRAFAASGGRRMVGAGTCAEYAWSGEPLSEQSSALDPATPYGQAKKLSFEFCQQASRDEGFSMAWGRIFHTFGPFENANRIVPYVVTSLARGREALCTEGLQTRDFLYVEDVADAFVFLLESPVCGAVNVASGEPRTLRKLVLRIGEAMGRPELIRFGGRPSNPQDPATIIADVQKMHREAGWRPKYTLERGLEKTIAWWSNQAADIHT